MPTSTPEQRRKLLYYFMAGDPRGGSYKGQLRTWVAYLYNVPNDSIPTIVENYIATHDTVDRAIKKTGSGLVNKLFYNEVFFRKLNRPGRLAFTEIDISDVLAVVRRFCRMGRCRACGKSYRDISSLNNGGKSYVCGECGKSAVSTDFPKIVTIARVIEKHRGWFQHNLERVMARMREKYLAVS